MNDILNTSHKVKVYIDGIKVQTGPITYMSKVPVNMSVHFNIGGTNTDIDFKGSIEETIPKQSKYEC